MARRVRVCLKARFMGYHVSKWLCGLPRIGSAKVSGNAGGNPALYQ